MTEFIDEQILELKKQKNQQLHASIETGVFVGEEYYEFQSTEVCGGMVRLLLPDSFVDMPPNIARVKYPSEMRPQVIKTSLDTTVNFMFNYYDAPLANHQVQEAADDYRKMIRRMNPAAQFFDFETLSPENKPLVWFDFKSNGLDAQLYNIIFCTPIAGNVFQGFLNCAFSDADDWRPVMLQVLETIEDISAEREAGR